MKRLIIFLIMINIYLPVYSASINAAAFRTMQLQAYEQQRNQNVYRPQQQTPYWQMQSNYSTRNRIYSNYSDYTMKRNYQQNYSGYRR